MARIYQQGGEWHIDYRYRRKRVRRCLGTNKRDAERILRDVKLKIATEGVGLTLRGSHPSEALQEYLTYSKEVRKNVPNYVRYQRQILEGFVQECRVTKLEQIRPADVARWLQGRAQKVAVSTVRQNFKRARGFLRWCVRFGYLPHNPSDSVDNLPVPARRPIRFCSTAEVEALLNHSEEPLRTMILVGVYAGLRIGEIRHLTWDCIDLADSRGVLHVWVSDEFIPKDREGRRIPLHPKLRTALDTMHGDNGVTGLLFRSSKGKILHERYVARTITQAAQRAGLPGPYNFRMLRRTFGSWLTMAGVDMHRIAKLMGHSSVVITEKHYAELRPETLHDDIDRLP